MDLARLGARIDAVTTVDPRRLVAAVEREGLATARAALQIGADAWSYLLDQHPGLAERIDEAERHHLESLTPRLIGDLEAADDDFALKKAKLIGDRIQWLLERRAPERYGNRVQMSLAVSFDLRVAVEEAQERVRLVSVTAASGTAAKLVG